MGEGVTPGKDPPDRIPSPAPNESEDNALLDSQEQTRREDSGGPRDKHATREDCEKDSYDASSTGDTNNATGDLVASESSEGADNSVTTQECESQGAGGASQEATGVFNKFNKLELNLEGEWTTVRKGRPSAKKPTTYAPPIGHKPVTGRRVLRAGEDFGNRKKSEQGATTVWTAQGAAAIRAKLGGSAGTPLDLTTEREDETVHAQYYMCALKKPKAMMRDGDQRPMTKKEKHTLFLWASKQIHLAEPPLFIDETHVGKEQDAIRDFHKDHLGYRLYMRLPVGTKWSHRSGQKLLVMALMEGCKDNDAQEKRVLRLLSDVQEVLLEPNSQIVTLRFVRPDIRKVWMDQTFNFHRPT